MLDLARQTGLDAFQSDPLLALAAALLIVVSVVWVLVWRAFVRRAEAGGGRIRRRRRDIWAEPP